MNVAMGSVLRIWHKYRTEGIEDEENAALPPTDQLKEAAKHTDINKVIIDERNSTVFLEDPEMSLDVGAVAKGYAVEQVSQIAMKNGFDSGLISVGGNVRAIGDKGVNRQPWNLGIQNPDLESSETTIQIVYVKDSSLVTSGDYERYYTVNGKNYHHIIDPVTLFPSEYFKSVSIICRDSGIADALSTSVFIMPFEKGLSLIDSLPETAAMWVMKDGEIRKSKDFDKYTKK
jgi:thiamine biosynthesis lipoprotein